MAIQVRLNGQMYERDSERGWLSADNMVPPKCVILELNRIAARELAEADETISDPSELLDRAKLVRDAGELNRAERLARRALERFPGRAAAAAVLSSILRQQRRSDEALEVTDAFAESTYAPIYSTRAAAFCDICERFLDECGAHGGLGVWGATLYLARRYWEDADRSRARAFALSADNPDGELFALNGRIASARTRLDEVRMRFGQQMRDALS